MSRGPQRYCALRCRSPHRTAPHPPPLSSPFPSSPSGYSPAVALTLPFLLGRCLPSSTGVELHTRVPAGSSSHPLPFASVAPSHPTVLRAHIRASRDVKVIRPAHVFCSLITENRGTFIRVRDLSGRDASTVSFCLVIAQKKGV